MRFFAGFLIFISMSAAEVFAEDPPAPAGTAAPAAEEEQPEEAAQIAIATPTPEEEEEPVDENHVEPLDSWYVRPTPTPIPGAGEAAGETKPPEAEHHSNGHSGNGIEEEAEEEEEVLELESVDTDAQLPESAANKAALDTAQKARRIQLTKSQKERIRQARIRRHRVMRETAKLLDLERKPDGDPRGAPELRICTLNLNNYGTVADYKRMFKVAQLPRREGIENAALAAIAKGKCDIVAVQSLLGTSQTQVELAAKQFLKKLRARTGSEWESYLGSPGRQVVRSAFFIRAGAVEVKKDTAYDEMRLTNFGAFSLEEFPRPPLQLNAKVPGKDGAKEKDFIFLTYDFRQSLVATKPEPEQFRMQIADGIRQIIHTAEEAYPPEDPAVVVLLGERMGPQTAPATQLLEGRLRLIDFTVDGGCALSPENKVECNEKPRHLKEFYGVSTEGFLLSPKMKTRKEEETEKKVLVYPGKAKVRRAKKKEREKTAEIYLKGPDLVHAQQNMYYRGRYRTGTIRARTGLDSSPLVWAELNW